MSISATLHYITLRGQRKEKKLLTHFIMLYSIAQHVGNGSAIILQQRHLDKPAVYSALEALHTVQYRK